MRRDARKSRHQRAGQHPRRRQQETNQLRGWHPRQRRRTRPRILQHPPHPVYAPVCEIHSHVATQLHAAKPNAARTRCQDEAHPQRRHHKRTFGRVPRRQHRARHPTPRQRARPRGMWHQGRAHAHRLPAIGVPVRIFEFQPLALKHGARHTQGRQNADSTKNLRQRQHHRRRNQG